MVFHCDLHGGNIFLHWEDLEDGSGLPDFYIGDFGNSKSVRLAPSGTGTSSHEVNIPWPWDVSYAGLLKCLRGLINAARLGSKPAADPRDIEIERLRKVLHDLNVADLKRNADFMPMKGWATLIHLSRARK